MADGEKFPSLGAERLRLRAAECAAQAERLRALSHGAPHAQQQEYLDLALQWERLALQFGALAKDRR